MPQPATHANATANSAVAAVLIRFRALVCVRGPNIHAHCIATSV
jgi:hypothetical protein